MNALKKKGEFSKVKVSLDDLGKIIDYFTELNVLKRTPRLGWRFTGAPVEKDPVAGHVALVAQMAYIGARLKGLNPYKAIALAIFHDNPETRLSDQDKISGHYLKITRPHLIAAVKEQTERLPKEIAEEIQEYIVEAEFGKSPEAILVKDLDIFEASLQAKIFDEEGYTIPPHFLKKYLDPERFQTEEGKKLVEILKQRKSVLSRLIKKVVMSL